MPSLGKFDLGEFVQSKIFQNAVLVVVLLNAILLGVQYEAR